eukprot:4134822-Pleurochrysis_carterae.AAC.5
MDLTKQLTETGSRCARIFRTPFRGDLRTIPYSLLFSKFSDLRALKGARLMARLLERDCLILQLFDGCLDPSSLAACSQEAQLAYQVAFYTKIVPQIA